MTSTQHPAALVVGFLNSLDVEEGADAFARLDEFREWTKAQPDLAVREPSEADRQDAVRFRDALREAVA